MAVYDTDLAGSAALRAHAVYSQIALHAEYGGVVPELASRDHVRKLLPLVRQTLADAGLGVGDIDGVAYTAGPGLVGALLVGAGVARSLAWALEVPAVGVHHMEGHLLAPLMEDDPPQARSLRCWCPVAIPSWWRWMRSASTGCWAKPWTMRLARPSTRPPS